MEKDPLLSQYRGRPPNNNKQKSLNIKKETHSTSKGTNASANANLPSAQTEEKLSSKSKENETGVKNSQLGKLFFDAIFENQSANQSKCESSGNVQILENIQIQNCLPEMQNEALMEHETLSISSLEDEFQTVKNKKRTFKGDVKINSSSLVFKTSNNVVDNTNRSNKYSLLGDLNVEAVGPTETNSKCDNSKFNNYSNTEVRNKNTYCPPIFLEKVNVQSLIDQLKAKNVEFKIKNSSKYKSKLYFKDSSAHSEMLELLREKEIPSYTYTPKEHKRQRLVCRGLYYKSDVETIKLEIDKIVPETVESVSKFSTDYSRKHGTDTGLFLVTLKPNRSVNELLGIKYILSQVVSWERPKASTKIPQCWRCQKWGHYSRNCTRPFSCMKCQEKHAPGECAFLFEGNELPFCVNCNETGHTSNYRGCPAYKKYVSFRKKSFQESKVRKMCAADNVDMALNPSSLVSKDKSFASLFNVLGAIPSQIKPAKSPLILEFMKIAKALCASEPLTLEEKISNFMRNYKTMTRDQAVKECVSLVKDIQDVYGP